MDISPIFLAFELMILVIFLVCLRDAVRDGIEQVLLLLAGVSFGVLLEWATIQQLHAYRYGRFLVMLGDVPLVIGVAWGCIIYSAYKFSDLYSLRWWESPFMDGLLALNIDLAMDTIAIRLGMWNWGQDFSFQFFGVPWANFWAWFWVVSSFLFGYRISLRWLERGRKWLAPIIAILIGLIGVLGTNYVIVFVVPKSWYKSVIAFTLLGALTFILAQRSRLTKESNSALVFWVPFSMHLFFLVGGLVTGVIFQPPILLLISALMILTCLLLHRKYLVSPRRATVR